MKRLPVLLFNRIAVLRSESELRRRGFIPELLNTKVHSFQYGAGIAHGAEVPFEVLGTPAVRQVCRTSYIRAAYKLILKVQDLCQKHDLNF